MDPAEHPPTMVALSLLSLLVVAAVLSQFAFVPVSLVRDLLVAGVVTTLAFALVWRYWLSNVEGM